ncbi:DUF551 domain-containing protein [Escherichia coli]
MTTITKERIELFIKNPLENGLTRGEQMELARIALASLEAEPVAECIVEDGGMCIDGFGEYVGHSLPDGTHQLYTAPPAQVVPDEMYWQDAPVEGSSKAAAYATGWNACRAAMLHSAEPASNHEELPLDYLQGQKDGLEWAAQLAEANHPQTGDWLYDDPLELAKAIRKGPDMPEFDGPTPVTPDGWISCSERMPNEEDILVYCSDTKEQMVGFHKGKGLFQFFYMNGVDGVCEPSHWMPLPEPPL